MGLLLMTKADVLTSTGDIPSMTPPRNGTIAQPSIRPLLPTWTRSNAKNPLAHSNAFHLDTDVRSASTQKPSELTDGRKRSEPAVAVTSLSHKLLLLTLPPHAL